MLKKTKLTKKEYNLLWYRRNKEYRNAYNKDWRLRHPEKVKEYDRQKYLKNPEKTHKRIKKWKKQNPEKVKISSEKYYKNSTPEKRKNTALLRKYGISFKEREQMVQNQNNTCAICGTLFDENKQCKKSCIDHDHITDKTRGILCNNCNLALGLIDDNINTAKNIVCYLERYTHE